MKKSSKAKRAPLSSPLYHLGFGLADLGREPPTLAFLCGDPERSAALAQDRLRGPRPLSRNRGLWSFIGTLPGGRPALVATTGMGAPSMSIVVNELRQLGISTFLRVGTCGSIQPQVVPGSVVISQAAVCRQGAANDVAPVEYPATADPFITVALVEAARRQKIPHHLGITASTDTFYEGQERRDSANIHLLRALDGLTNELRTLGVLNYEMEAATLFKLATVYGAAAGCVCGVVAQRTRGERIVLEVKDEAIRRAIDVAVDAAGALSLATNGGDH